MKKCIFISGGVCSSLGKGIAASSLGALLECRGLAVCMIKCDPYINVDAGTMSPYQHGEVYVTDDGAETDLDLGNYARFTHSPLSHANSITTGQVYASVIGKERRGDYLGRCVQVIPHITDEIKERILAPLKEDTDIVIVEIGGTVGDIESIPFFEAARQLIHDFGRHNALSVHLTLVPEVAGKELKTKPTQHSVKMMQELGIQPDILICRAPIMLDSDTRRKIANFTNVDVEAVFTSYNVDSTIYALPLIFYEQKLDQIVLKKLCVESRHADLLSWKTVNERFNARKGSVTVGVIGKYMELRDSYQSVFEALFHAGLEVGVDVDLLRINSTSLEEQKPEALLEQVDGILIPGGFGQRGIEGMIIAAAWAREHAIPYFGICLGMHIMVIEWARHILGWNDANSTEFNTNTTHPVISLLEEQVNIENYGGTMRLGRSESIATEKTHIAHAYKTAHIFERHRHRYEFSNQYQHIMKESGLICSAFTPDGALVEAIELPHNPWAVGVQFHPEFKSKPMSAAPLFRDFIAAIKNNTQEKAIPFAP
ncbi:MAG: CTP synthase [Treponema sp.]|jgi:CTP synthase|nr:CTP synthase [Treponema sp.]